MIRTAIQVHPGPRESLEDAAVATTLTSPQGTEAVILVLCDGVGGHERGERASELGVSRILAVLTSFIAAAFARGDREAITEHALIDAVTTALGDANRLVLEVAQQESCPGMASTAVCAVIVEETAVIGWVGDSRCYHFQDGRITYVTRDHSVVMELLDAGAITPQQALSHESAHRITRCLGQAEGFEASIVVRRVQIGDVLLLCSDGLTDVLSDVAIEEVFEDGLSNPRDPQVIASALLSSALAAETHDNVSVLCCGLLPEVCSQVPYDNRTATGDYVITIADALHRLNKEKHHASNRRTPVPV